MKALMFLLTGVIALLALAIAATGCGGGEGGATTEEYFRQVEALVDDLGQQSEALGSKWEEDSASVSSDQERLELTAAFYYDLFSLIGGFRDGLADIEPSEEVEKAHQELVGIADEFSKLWSEMAAEVRSAASEADLEELLTDDRFEAVGQRFEEACFELQRIADDSGIDVDLQCGE